MSSSNSGVTSRNTYYAQSETLGPAPSTVWVCPLWATLNIQLAVGTAINTALQRAEPEYEALPVQKVLMVF